MYRRIRALSPRQALPVAIFCAALAACTSPAPAPVATNPAPAVAVAPPPSALVPAPVPMPPPGLEPTGPAFVQKSIVLYQPNEILEARLGDPRPLAAYIRRIDKALAKTLAAAPPMHGFSAAEVIAVKPGASSHAWLVSHSKIPATLAAQLDEAAQSVAPVPVQGGPIAFAIIFNAFGGGGKPVIDAAHPIPIPREWRTNATGESALSADGPPAQAQQ